MHTTTRDYPQVGPLRPLTTGVPELLSTPRTLPRNLFLLLTDSRTRIARVRFQDPTYFQDPASAEGLAADLFLLVEPSMAGVFASLWMDTARACFPLANFSSSTNEVRVTPCFERYPHRPSSAEVIALFEPYFL